MPLRTFLVYFFPFFWSINFVRTSVTLFKRSDICQFKDWLKFRLIDCEKFGIFLNSFWWKFLMHLDWVFFLPHSHMTSMLMWYLYYTTTFGSQMVPDFFPHMDHNYCNQRSSNQQSCLKESIFKSAIMFEKKVFKNSCCVNIIFQFYYYLLLGLLLE